MPEEPKCPECEGMVAVREKSQTIGEFLEWLQGVRNLTLCRQVTHEEAEADENDELVPDMYLPERTNIEKLLAEYFHIDLERVESEKQAILKYMREKVEKGG